MRLWKYIIYSTGGMQQLKRRIQPPGTSHEALNHFQYRQCPKLRVPQQNPAVHIYTCVCALQLLTLYLYEYKQNVAFNVGTNTIYRN